MGLSDLARSRFVRGVVVGVAISVMVGVGVVLTLRSMALSPECADLRREDLTLDEMIAIKRRVDGYRRDPSGALVLSGREASFIVREHLRVQAWLGVNGDEIEVDLRIPQAQRCYDVTFHGQVEVADGVVRVVPTVIRVGRLDLTWWAGGTPYEIRSEQVSEEAAADLLGHVVSLQVDEGTIAVRLDDPEILK
jgi:hypothetical protein